eukprot:2322621-Pyramimonas_sp.AAC.1
MGNGLGGIKPATSNTLGGPNGFDNPLQRSSERWVPPGRNEHSPQLKPASALQRNEEHGYMPDNVDDDEATICDDDCVCAGVGDGAVLRRMRG